MGKNIPYDFRERLRELKGARLAVWLAYFLHADGEGFAWPSLKKLAEETGLHPRVVMDVRKELCDDRWLLRRWSSEDRDQKGRFPIPMFTPVIPDKKP